MAKYSKMEISNHMNRKAELIFKVMDSDQDGIYSIKDMMGFPDELRRVGKVALADKLVKAYQGNWDRLLQFAGKPSESTGMNKDEFVKGVTGLRQTEWYSQEFLPQIVDVYFSSMDLNSDGLVDLDEWRSYYKARGVEDESFVQWTFGKMDTNGDGFISREEFQYAYVQLGIGEDPDQDYSFLYGIKHPYVD